MHAPPQPASAYPIDCTSQQDLPDRLALFARGWITNHPALFHQQEFPRELFPAMGEQGLLGIADLAVLSRGAYVLTRETGSLGFSIAWALQSLIPLVLSSHAKLDVALLADVHSGAAIIALAISEPGAGANPKLLSTTADMVAGGWRLNGEKAYVTNGPLASHIAVLAITALKDGRKAFSMFMVPAGSPGLFMVQQQLDGLLPAQHSSLVFRDCFVPDSALIGRLGQAFPDIALPFRAIEDTVLSGTLIGALDHAVHLAASSLLPELTSEQAAAFGDLGGLAAALDLLRASLNNALQSGRLETDTTAAQVVAVHDLARRSVDVLRDISPEGFTDVTRILRDVEKFLGIARAARQARKEHLGRSYFLPAS